tara:strand:- start:9688 stop:10170 length:483 start_codon:yes stop_codon:yes gene_type:complete
MTQSDPVSIEENFDIIISLVVQFGGCANSFEFEDLLQVAFVGYFKAVSSFDSNIGPLRPYIFSCVKNNLNRFLRKELRWQNNNVTNSTVTVSYDDKSYVNDFKNVLASCASRLLPAESFILDMKSQGFSRKEICDMLTLTKKEYYNLFYSGVGKIQRYET